MNLRLTAFRFLDYIMDEFAFNESRYINSHIDYEILQRENIYAERAFVLPNDKLSAYENVINKGIFNFNDKRNIMLKLLYQIFTATSQSSPFM